MWIHRNCGGSAACVIVIRLVCLMVCLFPILNHFSHLVLCFFPIVVSSLLFRIKLGLVRPNNVEQLAAMFENRFANLFGDFFGDLS